MRRWEGAQVIRREKQYNLLHRRSYDTANQIKANDLLRDDRASILLKKHCCLGFFLQ